MIVTLCGSARFEQDFINANRELTLRGVVVYSLACMPSDHGGKDWCNEEQKMMLDLAHLAKISASDAIFVVGDGYVGESTTREIAWARMNGKAVVWQKQGFSWDTLGEMMRSRP